jgi:rhodanese-related sulfurtransferase
MKELLAMDYAPENIDVAAAVELLQSGALLLDVREDDEWEAGHAPDASHIRLSEVPDKYEALAKERPIVCVCRAGGRSARAAAFLGEQGFTTYNLDGGMNAWHAADEPVVTDAGTVGDVI